MSTKADINIKAMSDSELAAFAAQAQAELAERARKRKEDTIAKIRALASEVGLSVAIDGARGRPGGRSAKKKGEVTPADAKRAAPVVVSAAG
jgi:hypothetical protein